MKRRPQPTQAQSMGHVLTDTALLEMLLEKATLSEQQTEAYTGYLVQLAAGLARLPKTVRDHGIAVAKAAGLLARTELKRPHLAGTCNPGDSFSAVRTRGTEYAERLLAKPLPMRPPTRRAG